jgi:hypothetical protein
MGAAFFGWFGCLARPWILVGVVADWDIFLPNTFVLASCKGVGDEEIRSANRALGLEPGSSSSSDAEEDDGRTLRFRRFAGGAMTAESDFLILHRPVGMQSDRSLTSRLVLLAWSGCW